MSRFAWAVPLCLLMSINMIAAAAETYKDVEFSRAGGVVFGSTLRYRMARDRFPPRFIVHGGGWVRGDRRTDVAPLFKPLADAGIAWFSIDYRLQADPLRFGVAVERCGGGGSVREGTCEGIP